jgi:predicted secreted protein
MAKVAFLAHCLLNQNAKVIGGAKRPGMWEPVIDLLLERGWTIRQMPCPELAFGGVRRFWWVRDQADTPVFREHCRRLARTVAATMEPHVQAGDDVVLIGVDSSPTMGVDFQPTSDSWGGEPNVGDTATPLVPGEGIFLEELAAELGTRNLPMPRRTGIRHWFPDYDPAEEHARIVALLEAGSEA